MLVDLTADDEDDNNGEASAEQVVDTVSVEEEEDDDDDVEDSDGELHFWKETEGGVKTSHSLRSTGLVIKKEEKICVS